MDEGKSTQESGMALLVMCKNARAFDLNGHKKMHLRELLDPLVAKCECRDV